jgi:large subunit ribosomal protein L10
MGSVRTAKVAVVDDVAEKIATTSSAVVTEYRGLTVAEISTLRRQLRQADAEYKVLKNTLVRRAVEGTDSAGLAEFLVGPTAIAWVKGDISAVAKILRDFAKATPTLIIKGGVISGKPLSAKDLTALADLPSREVLLAQLAGLMAAPMRQMASLLKAVPQNFAYGLSALIDAKGGPQSAPAPEAEAAATPAGVEESDDTEAAAEVVAEEAGADALVADETTEAVEETVADPAE